ncbi:hypothetical protein niasHT_022665 [Heterodera trifolii]|uniref:UDP-galactose transporter n=1 Tax=Heterodera trifolii TaxID=157864 RepID=A0ABD2JRF9_9BILA
MQTVVSTEKNEPTEEEEGHGLLNHSQNRRESIRPILLKYVSLLVLVLQNACHVLVTRYAMTRVAILFNELVKLCVSLILFFISTNDLCKFFKILYHHFGPNCLDTLKVGVPAVIYLVQNLLIFLAIENLETGTYMVTYQLKILTTAFFAVLILKRKLSITQWVALFILVAGVALVQYCTRENACEFSLLTPDDPFPTTATVSTPQNESTKSVGPSPIVPSNTQKKMQNPVLGLVYVLIACFLSGFAGIYFEKILKGSEVSIWLRNIQLSSLSIPFGILFIAVKEGSDVLEKGVLHGFDSVVWISVLLQAIGGLVVAVVIKYADNILKAFATSVSIVVATVASILLLGTEPKLMFFLGATFVIIAVVFYGVFPYREKEGIAREKGGKRNSEEMQVIVSSGGAPEKQRKGRTTQ